MIGRARTTLEFRSIGSRYTIFLAHANLLDAIALSRYDKRVPENFYHVAIG